MILTGMKQLPHLYNPFPCEKEFKTLVPEHFEKLLSECRYLFMFIHQPDDVQVSKHISFKDGFVHIEK
jgi:hypothetical protein